MRVIVPGGYYSYDSAGKKIWLDYQYYGTTLENIERVKNLTRNKILYDCKRSTVLPIVSNGCITHSYQGTEADADKIQVTLKTPITNSLTELTPVDGVVTLETDGKVLVLPTSNAAILPSFNQSVLNSNLLTIAESPFGGLKGSGSPDYAPGTLFCQTDGVYLTDTSGTNSTKTLTAGKLKELSLLTVDTAAHTITEEFIVENTTTSNNPTVINQCESTTGVAIKTGTGTLSLDNVDFVEGQGSIKGVANGSDVLTYLKFTFNLNLSTCDFITCSIKGTAGKLCMFYIDDGTNSAFTQTYTLSNTWCRYVIPLKKMTGIANINLASVKGFRFDITNAAANDEYQIDNITADTAKPAYIELQTPDNLTDSSLTLQAWDGSAYQTTGVYKLDSSYEAVSTTSANWKLSDGTKFDDCYGSGNGRSLFPKGASAETKAGSSGSITYSANKGTSKRIGFRVDLPPSDGGRTNFNKCRMKAILSYTDTVGNIVPDLSGNNNTGTIVGGVTKLNSGGLQFDGSTGYLNCANTNLTILGPKTISTWVKINARSDGNKDLISKGSSYSVQNYGIWKRNAAGSDIGFSINDGTSSKRIVTGTYVEGELIHVVGVYDGTNLFLYLNAVKISSLAIDEAATLATSNVNIGKGGFGYLNGVVGDTRIYSRALSDTEVTALYNNQSVSSVGLVARYNPTVSNMGSTTHDFADSTNTSYGLQNLSKPWIALYSPTDSLIDFYLFTHRPQNLSFKRDETGTIYSISLYPGAGSVYHGQIPFADLTLDTNSDTIPDCLEAAVNGSVTKFLENYTMVI